MRSDPKGDTSASRTVVDVCASTVVATGVALRTGVPHVKLAATVAATQQPCEQRFAPAQRAANHLPFHVGVVGDQALVVLVGVPGNVSLVMLCDQDLPLLTRATKPSPHALTTLLDAHPSLSAPKDVRPGVCVLRSYVG